MVRPRLFTDFLFMLKKIAYRRFCIDTSIYLDNLYYKATERVAM